MSRACNNNNRHPLLVTRKALLSYAYRDERAYEPLVSGPRVYVPVIIVVRRPTSASRINRVGGFKCDARRFERYAKNVLIFHGPITRRRRTFTKKTRISIPLSAPCHRDVLFLRSSEMCVPGSVGTSRACENKINKKT